jgi:hypothetical protein
MPQAIFQKKGLKIFKSGAVFFEFFDACRQPHSRGVFPAQPNFTCPFTAISAAIVLTFNMKL